MASVLVPVLYLALVIGGLLVFSVIYRRRAAAKTIAPYFPAHPARDVYVSLLQADPPAHDKVLKAALVARAVTDVGRVLQLREDKPALQALLQKGSVGDDLWAALLAAEKELEAEILDVVSEANTYVPGWGQIVFETASQVVANDKMRAMLEATPRKREEAEAIYGYTKRPTPPIAPVSPAPQTLIPPPTLATNGSAPAMARNMSSSSSAAPATPISPLKSPLSKFKELAPSSAASDSGASSDADSIASGPQTPSKSAKKNKKRK